MKKSPSYAIPLTALPTAVPFLRSGATGDRPLLTDKQRQKLARIGTRMRLPRRHDIYREREPADSVYAVVDGVVKTYRKLARGRRTVNAFLFARDLFGLAENGRYLNSAETITAVTLYRLPLHDLVPLIKHDPDLQFRFLVKVTHELRESQGRAILLGRRDAVGRLAMFLSSQRLRARPAIGHDRDIPLPMSRSDIADFLGLSRETMSRAFARLERAGLLTFKNRGVAHIIDPVRFSKLARAV